MPAYYGGQQWGHWPNVMYPYPSYVWTSYTVLYLQFYMARFIFTMHLYCTNSKQVNTYIEERHVYILVVILAYISTYHMDHGMEIEMFALLSYNFRPSIYS